MHRRPPRSTLFPSTTLFRSVPRPVCILHLPHHREARLLENAAALRALDWRVGHDATHLRRLPRLPQDRKSTRLNSSHANISYAVFCLKKKKINNVTADAVTA